MEQIMKAARLLKAEVTEEDLALISVQALRSLAAEEVYTFRLAACNNQVDRDLERFTERTLEALAKLFVGRPVLLDHKWSAGSQTARVYAAGVEEMPGVEGGQQLVLRCYMPRLQGNGDTIAAIETGLLRECSVGVAVERAVCSICGTDRATAWCEHVKGCEYDGKLCYDNYAALLHEGERVLTAREAREMDRKTSSPIQITVTGNWSVRTDEDVDAIAAAILRKVELAQRGGVR